MTGYGEASAEEGTLRAQVEIRTVNNRFLKLSLRSSESTTALEVPVESLVRKHVKRGSVSVQINLKRQHDSDSYQIHAHVLDAYRRQLEKLCNTWHLADTVPLGDLLDLPGVVAEDEQPSIDLERDWPVVEKVLNQALGRLTQMRTEEGTALEADLRQQCATVAEQLDRVAERSTVVAEEYRQRLADRVDQALEKFDIRLQPADVIREVSLFAERSDISEEIVRLRSHLEQFLATIDLPESSGRKLDFITQEMFREANTIGSKASDVQIPRHVVEIKTAIERIREQIQNVE